MDINMKWEEVEKTRKLVVHGAEEKDGESGHNTEEKNCLSLEFFYALLFLMYVM